MPKDLEEQLAELQEKIAERRGSGNGNGNGHHAPGFLKKKQSNQGLPEPIGWSVPIEVEAEGAYGRGKVCFDLSFGAETWEQAGEIIQELINQGYPVKVWTPKTGGYGGARRFGGGYRDRGSYGRD